MEEYTKPMLYVVEMVCEGIMATSFSSDPQEEVPPVEELIRNPIDLGNLFE